MGRPRTRVMNPLETYFRGALYKKNISQQEFADRLFIEKESLMNKYTKPWRTWTLGQIEECCEVIGVPMEEALRAALKCKKEEQK